MQTAMPRLGACYLHMYGGPLDGERVAVLRDAPDKWPHAVVFEKDWRPEITETIYYELVQTPAGPYYCYAGVTDAD